MAIFELCKNGYDADAPKVDIFFENLSEGVGKIRIVDTGDGMTKKDIINKFMTVATSSRVRKTTTDAGRIVAGEKGIGRFSMERLSHKTTIYSYPKGESKGYKLTIEWDRYEVEGISIGDVGNDFEIIEKDDPKRQGVEIVSEILRENWNEEKIRKVMNQLKLLVAPEGFSEKSPFDIFVTALEFGIKGKAVKSAYFEKAAFKMVAHLEKDGVGRVQIWLKNKEKLVGTGVEYKVFEYYQKNHGWIKKLYDKLVDKGGSVIDELDECGPVTYQMWGYPDDPPDENKWAKYYGVKTVHKMRQWVNDNSGIRIYRDGFRVMPYGEPDNDWTERSEKSRLSSGALAKKHIIGWVKITQKDNPGLVPSATRFHLIEDEKAFIQLKQFIQSCDRLLDEIVHFERVKEAKEKKQRNIPNQLESISKRIRGMKYLPDEIKLPLSREITGHATYLRKEEQEQKINKEILMSKLEAYRDLASLGIQTGVVSHEVSQDLGNLVALSEVFERDLKKGQLTKKYLFDLQTDLSNSIRFIRDYMILVRNFTVALQGDHDEFRRKSTIDVRKEIEFYKEKMDPLFERYDIRIINLIPEETEYHMYRADFQSIIFNLFSNSIKAIIRRRNKLDPIKRAKTKNTIKINLALNPGAGYSGFVFSDDGTGIRSALQDRIFDLFFTDYNKPGENLKGTGLGLTLVQEIVEGYDGDIELVPESEFKPGASFLVKFKTEQIAKN